MTQLVDVHVVEAVTDVHVVVVVVAIPWLWVAKVVVVVDCIQLEVTPITCSKFGRISGCVKPSVPY